MWSVLSTLWFDGQNPFNCIDMTVVQMVAREVPRSGRTVIFAIGDLLRRIEIRNLIPLLEGKRGSWNILRTTALSGGRDRIGSRYEQLGRLGSF